MPTAPLLVALLTATAAAAVALSPPTAVGEMANEPWPSAAVRVASLGRASAGADIAWMKTVQLIGTADLARQRYPKLEQWVDLVTRLEPRFETAYYFGAILLVTDTSRSQTVDDILARGETALPNAMSLSMARGFLAYFGRFDLAAASKHYADAAAKPGAPAWLGDFAKHLSSESLSCSSVMRDLKAVSGASSSAQAAAMAGARGQILVACWARTIQLVDTKYKLEHGRGLTVDEYVKQGIMEPPPTLPGMCWTLDTGRPALVGCDVQ